MSFCCLLTRKTQGYTEFLSLIYEMAFVLTGIHKRKKQMFLQFVGFFFSDQRKF